jgi:hypothetical protein
MSMVLVSRVSVRSDSEILETFPIPLLSLLEDNIVSTKEDKGEKNCTWSFFFNVIV